MTPLSPTERRTCVDRGDRCFVRRKYSVKPHDFQKASTKVPFLLRGCTHEVQSDTDESRRSKTVPRNLVATTKHAMKCDGESPGDGRALGFASCYDGLLSSSNIRRDMLRDRKYRSLHQWKSLSLEASPATAYQNCPRRRQAKTHTASLSIRKAVDYGSLPHEKCTPTPS